MFITINPDKKEFFETQLMVDKETIYGQDHMCRHPMNDMIVYDVKETETFEK